MGFGFDKGNNYKIPGKSFFQVPVFLFVFPFFFVFHNYYTHSGFIPWPDALSLFILYCGIGLFIYFLFFLLFRDSLKAAFVAVVLLSFQFFFGAFHDFLKARNAGFLVKYSVLVPAMLLIIIALIIMVRKKGLSPKLKNYLNLLFVILILFDVIQWLWKNEPGQKPSQAIIPCQTCELPDVYFIVLDGYAGKKQLETEFSFDNDSFLSELKSLGFETPSYSFSNYSNTPFSMASILNMEYLLLSDFEYTDANLNACFEKIYHNKVVQTFKGLGYEFINNSIFDIDGQPSPINKTYLKSGKQLITSQTFISRFRRDVYYNVLKKHFPYSRAHKNFLYSDLENNRLVYKRMTEMAGKPSAQPRFIYTHLMMPHFPYYFDESGRPYSIDSLLEQNYEDDKLYLPYLIYTNKKILELIEKIINQSARPPVIMLLSDHGFRKMSFSPGLSFVNLNAVKLPGNSEIIYPDTTSAVNQFSIFFNHLYKQKKPQQEDSIVK